MRVEQVIYTTERLQDSIVYYGDTPDDPIPVVTFTNEKKLDLLHRIVTGWKYSYIMTITDEQTIH